MAAYRSYVRKKDEISASEFMAIDSAIRNIFFRFMVGGGYLIRIKTKTKDEKTTSLFNEKWLREFMRENEYSISLRLKTNEFSVQIDSWCIGSRGRNTILIHCNDEKIYRLLSPEMEKIFHDCFFDDKYRTTLVFKDLMYLK